MCAVIDGPAGRENKLTRPNVLLGSFTSALHCRQRSYTLVYTHMHTHTHTHTHMHERMHARTHAHCLSLFIFVSPSISLVSCLCRFLSPSLTVSLSLQTLVEEEERERVLGNLQEKASSLQRRLESERSQNEHLQERLKEVREHCTAHTRTHAHAHTQDFALPQSPLHLLTHTHTHTHTHTLIHVNTHTHTHTCVIHVNTHTHT